MECNFAYEKINLMDLNHLRCLKDLWEDEENKKYLYTFSSQLSFEGFIKELGRSPYATLDDRLIKLNDQYIGWLKSSSYEAGNKRGYILSFSIIKEYRRIGIGRKFLEDYINGLGEVEVLLEISIDNLPSLRLAKSLGFEEVRYDEESGIVTFKLNSLKMGR
jgi:ribosomal protein S18 acetylase RimI-like enzyme